jgi:hypothetical protein
MWSQMFFVINSFPQLRRLVSIVSLLRSGLISVALVAASVHSQPPVEVPDEATIIRGVDAAVKHRVDSVAGFSDTEHYKLFRGKDLTTPAAEMIVRTTYVRETGKSYEVLSETGSQLLLNMVFSPLLENEKRINLPENRDASYFVSANYEMHLKPGGPRQINGRACYALTIHPHQKPPNLVEGTIWVDARDYSIVRIEGHGSKSASLFVDPTVMTRDYQPVDGFAMATHAKAVTESDLVGPTIVTIDYTDYKIRLLSQH